MSRPALAAACLALALVTFFQFPGHTWLQQDTQIYAPILEHQWDPAALRKDLLSQQPQVAFTLYDEAARGLRVVSGMDFRVVLEIQQVLARALGIWGLYLMALAAGSRRPFLVAMICALGATIIGPQVLTFEYEPSPRAIAIPLVMCALGLAARERYVAAAVAGAAAFLYHPPSALEFWVVFGLCLAWRRRARPILPIAAAVAVMAVAAHGHAPQPFFGRIPPFQEQLQRMRAAYNWISLWPRPVIWRHLALFAVVLAAYGRLRREIPATLRAFALGLPILGILSMPLSWLLLERLRWTLIPQLQPMRALLFVALMAQFLTALAGARAALDRRFAESAAWFFAAYLASLPALDARPVAVALLLALLAIFAARSAPVLGLAAFVAIPLLGGVVNYPRLHTPALARLAAWARSSTPRDAVFLFPDAGHALDPGIFRAEALRAVYVDWKGGGQVNYSANFAAEWQRRWQLTMTPPADPARDAALGIDYIVLREAHRLPGAAAFENSSYAVYALR